MITKRTEIDKIEIVGEYRHVQVRTATVIEEDGVELSRSYHRHVIEPGADTTNEDDFVKSVVASVHKPDLVKKYKDDMKKQEQPTISKLDL